MQLWSVLSGFCCLGGDGWCAAVLGPRACRRRLPRAHIYLLAVWWHVYHQRLTTEVKSECVVSGTEDTGAAITTASSELSASPILSGLLTSVLPSWMGDLALLVFGVYLLHIGCFMHHLSCSLWLDFLPFQDWLISHWMSWPHFARPFTQYWGSRLMWVVLLWTRSVVWTRSAGVLLLLLRLSRC